MQQIENNPGKIKTWRECRHVVLHSAGGRISGDLIDPAFIESLLNPDNFQFSGRTWVPVVVRDTLHLVHEIYTPCEGEA